MHRGPVVLALAMLGTVGTIPARAELDLHRVRPESVASCDSLVLQHPRNHEAYRCYPFVAQRHGLWSETVRSLEARLQVAPDDALATLYLGSIESTRRRSRAESLLRSALERLDATEMARLELGALLDRAGRHAEARALMEESRDLAQGNGETDLVAEALLQSAQVSMTAGDLITARSLYEQVRERLRDVEAGVIHARLASGLASAAWAEGRLEDSLARYRDSAEIYSGLDARFEEARERYNVALVAGRLFYRGAVPKSEVLDLAGQAVDVAIAGRNPGAEASARLLLAQDPDADFEKRIGEATRALELFRQAGRPRRVCYSQRMLASLVIQRDGAAGLDRALGFLDEAITCAGSVGNVEDQIRAWIVRGGLSFFGRPKADCVRDLQSAVEGIETLRDSQPDQLVRARFLWDWAFVYYRLSGHLLEPVNEPPDPDDANLAFRTIEKLRARILLDALDSARATEAAMNAGEGIASRLEERGDVLDRIASVQRDLMAPGVRDVEAETLLGELRRLEAREVELRVRMARSDPSIAMLRMPEIPSISDLQGVLAPDQAILSFQLSTREIDDVKWYWNGGSWVFVITRDDWFVEPLPDRDVLDKRIALYLGLLSRRDSLEREAGARLFEDLLSRAVESLDLRIRRWVVVPDGALHRLPFAALRPSADAEPLAARVAISEVPSATLWYHWKSTPARRRPSTVLALADADPAIDKDDHDDVAGERAVPWPVDEGLETLPYARTEARAMVRRLGSGSWLRTGRDASERFLKTAPLERFGILHLATHSVVDSHEPQRSSVLLSPGAPEEDGLLQIREVVDLDLDGSVVILSGCSSASGEITEGEGVVGMARAFFQAGARTVVGSLWPLRDDEAEGLMAGVGEELGRGASVGEAVASTRRKALAAGHPPTAWAGLVVLGDADHVPVPGGARRSVPMWLPVTAGLLGLLIVVTFVLRRRSH
jgi:CHAT domain-containing protein